MVVDEEKVSSWAFWELGLGFAEMMEKKKKMMMIDDDGVDEVMVEDDRGGGKESGDGQERVAELQRHQGGFQCQSGE